MPVVFPVVFTGIAESHLNHESPEIRTGAAQALVALAGIADPVHHVTALESEEGFQALSHAQQVVYCAFLFDAEIRDGGLLQFFSNESGDHAAETLEALEELGHPVAHDTLRTAMEIVGPSSGETDSEQRLIELDDRFDELEAAFEPLERSYYEASVPLEQSWLLYALRHAEQFRRLGSRVESAFGC